jgi:hypothetical protein
MGCTFLAHQSSLHLEEICFPSQALQISGHYNLLPPQSAEDCAQLCLRLRLQKEHGAAHIYNNNDEY